MLLNVNQKSKLARRRALFLTEILGCAMMSLAVLPNTRAQDAGASNPVSNAAPLVITLDEAIRRAQTIDPAYAAAAAERGTTALDRSIARNGLLPGVVFHNQALYTQPNGLVNQAGQGVAAQPAPRFIANNAVREYASQASINETLGVAGVAGVRHADAVAAQAAAELELARRGLAAGVTEMFFTSIAADRKLAVAESARQEASDFTLLTKEREQAREAAHADVVKAQLEEQQRDRDLKDAQVATEKARLELGVLLFPDPRTPFTLQPPADQPALGTRDDAEQAAAKNNPELKSALAALDASKADVLSARAAYLPDIGMNVTYGIDAPQVAVNGPDSVKNLGYSASLTLDIPVWDWLSTEHKVKQSEIRREAAATALTNTQRKLIAEIDEAYSEAAAAHGELDSLDQSVNDAAESLRLTKLRYTAGEATVLEVVDAQNEYVTIENAREDGQVRFQTAMANLETLTGKI